MGGSEIPLNSNFRNLSCQLGGLTLNGNIANGTAQSNTVITINDPEVKITSGSLVLSGKFLKVKVGSEYFYLPLYSV
jgi:hypothetical protein